MLKPSEFAYSLCLSWLPQPLQPVEDDNTSVLVSSEWQGHLHSDEEEFLAGNTCEQITRKLIKIMK